MLELYSVKETAKIFGLRPSQLRYWTQTGFIAPTVRKKGRAFYTLRDLIGVKTAVELLALGQCVDDARSKLDVLRKTLPTELKPQIAICISSDGDSITVVNEEQDDGDALSTHRMAFRVSSLQAQIERAIEENASLRGQGQEQGQALPIEQPPGALAAKQEKGGLPRVKLSADSIECYDGPSPYKAFQEGYAAEKRGDSEQAVFWYKSAIDGEPAMSAAHTNLGNFYYAAGNMKDARIAYETALEYEPQQIEARFNLANLYYEAGDTDAAILELRRVVSRCPDFADGHYNLGLFLIQVGSTKTAYYHFERYIELDSNSEWTVRACKLMSDSQ